MSHWMFKAAVQGGISFLPKNQFWNYLFQKYVTKSLDLNVRRFEIKLRQCKKHIENYFAVMPEHKTALSILELGTGWHPIIPIGLFLCGAAKIWTIDRTSLLSCKRVREVLQVFVKYAQRGDLIKILPWSQKNRISELQNVIDDNCLSSASQILEKLNIYTMIKDARATGIETSSIDFIISNTTLEYIPEDIIIKIFNEFRRLASSKVIMSHYIHMADHYADFDHSITPYNFLKYPNYIWRLFFNNSLHYQNRLRIADYRRIHQATGFKILFEHNIQGSLEDLNKIRIAKDFLHYSIDDLLSIYSWIISTWDFKQKANLSHTPIFW